MWQLVLLLLLMMQGGAARQAPAAPAGRRLLATHLLQDRTFTKAEGNGSDEARLIPDALVQGQPLGPPLAGVAAEEACSAACRQELQCRWFNYCTLPAGCNAVNGTQLLAFQECQLMTSNCSLHISTAPLNGVTSGFPVRLDGGRQISGFVQFPAQGILGADMECPESAVSGTCSFRSLLDAASTCMRTSSCRSVAVFPNGTDGCSSEPVAMLKKAGLNPADAFVSDKVYTLQVVKYQADESSFWLTASEGTVLLPNASEMAMGDDALAARGTWKGCILGANAIYDGRVLATLDEVASPKDCCRVCQASTARCTVWNWCDPSAAVNGVCSYQTSALTQETVVLNASQCQLRYQELAIPEVGSPPVLLAKGPAVPFTAGAPISVWAPEQPGFQRFVGRSNFAWGHYPCEGSLRPQAEECLLQAPLDQLASQCATNETCVALLYKPGGIINGTAQLTSLAYFKNDANPAKWLLSPTTIMFVEEGAAEGGATASSSGDSGGGGLSGGVIAGIAIGATALAAAAAAATWAVLRRRRTAAGAAAAVEDGKSLASGSPGSMPGWGGSPNGLDCPGKQDGEAKMQPPSAAIDDAMLSPFGLVAAAGVAGGTESCTTSTRSSCPPQQAAAAQQSSGPLRQSSGAMLQRVVPVSSSSAQAPQQQLASLPQHHHSAPSPPARASPSAGGSQSPPLDKQPQHGSMPPRPISTPKLPAHIGSHGRAGAGLPLGSSALPSALLSAGLSAALPPGSVVSSAQGMSPRRMSSRGTCASDVGRSSSSGGPDVIAELMGDVASRDAAQQTCSTSRSSAHSKAGQWMADLLPQRLHDFLVDPDRIEYMRWPNGKLVELGHGASAHVYKAVLNGEVVACKQIDLEESEEMQEAFVTEATRLHSLRHPNVIGFFGVSVKDGKGIVIVELAEGRDLQSALQVKAAGSTQRIFSWQRRGRRVVFELAKALNYLHNMGVVHMDVKSNNVLLTSGGTAKLADVGLSRLQKGTYLSDVPLIGTFAWIAPEVLVGSKQCTSAVDIFSLGVVMWEIVTGERPQRGSLRMPRVPEECPQDVCDLIMQCLSEEPSERPTAAQLLKTLSGMIEQSKAAHRTAAAADAGSMQHSPPASPLS